MAAVRPSPVLMAAGHVPKAKPCPQAFASPVGSACRAREARLDLSLKHFGTAAEKPLAEKANPETAANCPGLLTVHKSPVNHDQNYRRGRLSRQARQRL